MKFQLILVPVLFAFCFTACQQDTVDPTPEKEAITEEEAVDIVEGALSTQSSGITSDAMDAADIADEYAEKSGGGSPCGITFDSTVVRSTSNAYITANYAFNWEWMVICNDLEIPVSLVFDRDMNGTYATNRMESDDQAVSGWTVDNLFGGEPYVLNGSYERTGYQESLVGETRAFNSLVSIEIDDLVIDKDDHRIESGIASFTLTGEVVDGESFEITGDIIFLGDLSANLIINGNVYTIEL